MTGIIGSGVAFPLRLDPRGALALADGDRSVRDAIAVILGTARGERPMRPEFGCGVHELVFESVDALTVGRIEREVRVALDRWEPRIQVTDVRVDAAGGGAELRIAIDYVLRGTNDVRNLVHPFYLIPEGEEEAV
jgi:phage baseplate assembly protein W